MNWSTTSSTFPIIHILVDGLLLKLLTRILLMSKLISIPYLTAVFISLLVSCCSSSSLPPRRSISSANCKLQSGHPLMDTDDSELPSSSASSPAVPVMRSSSDCRLDVNLFCIIFSRNILNSTRNNGHSCFYGIRKKSPTLSFRNTIQDSPEAIMPDTIKHFLESPLI